MTGSFEKTSMEPGRRKLGSRDGGGASLPAEGTPMVWLTGGALAICVLMILGLLGLVCCEGLATFWPGPVEEFHTRNGRVYMGEVTRAESFTPVEKSAPGAGPAEEERILVRTGNFRITQTHFHWVERPRIARAEEPEWALVVERREWGRFYGFLEGFVLLGEPCLKEPGALDLETLEKEGKARVERDPEKAWALYETYHPLVEDRWRRRRRLEKVDTGEVNQLQERARLAVREAELELGDLLQGGEEGPAVGKARARVEEAKRNFARVSRECRRRFAAIRGEIRKLDAENGRYFLLLETAGEGKTPPVKVRLRLDRIVRAYPANRLGFGGKMGVYLSRWWEFLSADPREANSEGGVFPAIFGTVLMTLILALLVVPFGVLAALYLREYARSGVVVSAVRIAVNNLAGVPSIVFGVFGLGFFCYGLGAFVDGGPSYHMPKPSWFLLLGGAVLVSVGAFYAFLKSLARPGSRATRGQRALRALSFLLWLAFFGAAVLLVATSPFFHGFYRARLPNPTFGKGGLFWASLTLALMTVPVVIMATEEALSAVPNSLREGSYACGASKWQTIKRIVLPRAMPGVMTGMILAMARGAGEVAPLMLVGAVKLAPELPISSSPPFGLNRSFMHLGFHIYDVGFQSQNSEAAKPMVFTTTLLLILIVALLNLFAVTLRARLRRKFVSEKF